MLEDYSIDLIPFNIVTDSGRFCDLSEITSDNVLEYIAEGHKAISVPPNAEEYRQFFKEELEKFDSIIHITLSSGMSSAYTNAKEAADDFDGKVFAFDSRHISTGMGHLVIKARELADAGEPVDRITEYLSEMRCRVRTTFLAESADYLYFNGKVKKYAATLCRAFSVHPILSMAKDGRLIFGGVKFGNYEKAAERYIRKEFRKYPDIERKLLFITHAGFSTKTLKMVKNDVEKHDLVDRIEISNASATVSSNCGPNTFGILFVREKQD